VNEYDFSDLVERNREEVPVGHPPTDLLLVARAARRQRRLKALGITLASAVVVGAGGLGIHALASQGSSSHTARLTPSPISATGVTLDPSTGIPVAPVHATRQVGIDGWTVTVPGGWGTDQVGCDRTTPLRATVVFDHHDRGLPNCARTRILPREPSVHISTDPVPAVQWRTISGVAVRRVGPTADCLTCATITVPSASATFEIQARTTGQLHTIEHSLRPVSGRTITVPVWQVPEHGRPALDQMTQIALADGLRPRTVETPSAAPPGKFLASSPPLGTPVDSGRGITIVYSAGDLASLATVTSLHRHGWNVRAAASFSPAVTRDQAREAAGQFVDRTSSDVYLRTLTIVHSEPAGQRIQAVPTWLVASGVEHEGGRTTCTLTAVDADNGRLIETRTGFVGRP
jgi:hypothetical protein